LFKYFEIDQGVPEKHFVIGEAFADTHQFLSSWPGRGLDCYRDSFNYWLWCSCQCVECSFGMLMQLWGIFCASSLHGWSSVIPACMKLHNLCLDRNEEIPNQRLTDDVHDGDQLVMYYNFHNDDALLRGFPRGDHYRAITNKLEQLGFQGLFMMR
jgi:hypothetical protein